MAASSEAVSSENLALAGEFPSASRKQWQGLVEGVLRKSGVVTDQVDGAVEDLLATETPDGFTIGPLYTADGGVTGTGVPGLAPFTRGRLPQGSAVSGWDVRQRHTEPDPARVKADVLADLENGVTSLWLPVGAAGLPIDALGDVLAEVYLDLAAIVLDPGADYESAAAVLFDLLARRGVRSAEVRGNLGADPLGQQARTGTAAALDSLVALAKRSHSRYPELQVVAVDALSYHEAGGSDAEELGCSIAAGAEYLRALTAGGVDLSVACGLLEFRYAATADQFATIAKLRAARRLWSRIAEVSGAESAAGAQRQHAVTSSVMMTRRDPWVNMLRATLACFGAGAGGADAITVQPFDAALGLPDGFARRIARNTQSLLLEESRLGQVIDPGGGSWYVEWLTDRLAETAWAWFQDIERAGGLAAALDSGLVAERLAGTWAARTAAVAHRSTPITGVSEFPNLTEKTPPRPPAPTVPGGGLPRVRLAEVFEEFRARSDARLAATGARPRVFLATLGPVAAHTTRAGFAANLLQAGGIETVDAGATESSEDVVQAFHDSGATVACLCGSDKLYAERAEETVAALRAAGANRVMLAGKPGALASDSAAAQKPSSDSEKPDTATRSDVDGHLFAGCDAVAVLVATYRELEG